MANPTYAELYQNVISTANFLETNQSEIEEAAELQQTIFQQLYDEALEAREDEARVKMITGLVTVVVGGICIVATAGAATPAVIGIAGTIVGTSCAVYGASEMGEGAELFYLAEQGDIYTQPFNPIRDTVFVVIRDCVTDGDEPICLWREY